MNRKTNLILLVLVLVAGAYLMFLRNPKATSPSEETATPGTTRKLVSAGNEDVTKLSITPADDKPIVLEKKDGQWYLAEPVKGKAERFAVDDLLTGITQLQSRGQAGKADTGLNPPRYRVELGLKDGKSVKLAIGARSALGDTMFVQLDGSSGVDVVPADLDKKLGEPLSKLRDQRLTDVNAADIKQVTISGAAGRIVLHKTGEQWEMTEPQSMPVEPFEATDIVSQLSNLRATEFVNEDGAGAARYQLTQPQASVWFSTQAPATQPAASQPSGVTLNVGRYDGPEKRNVYANLSTSPGVVKVSSTVLNTLKKKPYELRDKKVVDIDPATVNRVALTTNTPATTQPTTRPASTDTTTVLRNEAAALQGPPVPAATQAATQPAAVPWVLEGSRAAANETKVDELLKALHPLQVSRYLAAMPDGPAGTTHVLVARTVAAGGAEKTYELKIIERGENEPPIGQFNGLTFELDRDVLSKLNLQ